MGALVNFLIIIAIFLVIYYIVRMIITDLKLPGKITNLLYLIIGLLALIWVLNYFAIYLIQ